MKTILVPVDFSPIADNALSTAALIARKLEARLLLLHVVEVPIDPVAFNLTDPLMPVNTVYMAGAGEVAAQLVQTAEKKLKMLAQDDRLKGIEIRTRVESDFNGLWNVDLSEHTTPRKADLIVMGSHGARGLKRYTLGSNAEKVVRHADCPVLVVKKESPVLRAEKIVYATDFSQDHAAVLRQLKAFAELFDAEICLLFICTPLLFQSSCYVRQQMNELARRLNWEKCSFHTYCDYSEEDGIVHFAEEMGANLIAMATHGRTGLNHLLNGSIAEDVVNRAAQPTLVLHHAH